MSVCGVRLPSTSAPENCIVPEFPSESLQMHTLQIGLDLLILAMRKTASASEEEPPATLPGPEWVLKRLQSYDKVDI